MVRTILDRVSKKKSRAFKKLIAKSLISFATFYLPLSLLPTFCVRGYTVQARTIDQIKIYEKALLTCREEQRPAFKDYTKKNSGCLDILPQTAENLIALQDIFFPEAKSSKQNNVKRLEEKITSREGVVQVGKDVYFSQEKFEGSLERVLDTDLIFAANGGSLYRLNKGMQKVEKMISGINEYVLTPKEDYFIRNGEVFMINSSGVINKVADKSSGTVVKSVNNTGYSVLFGTGKPLVVGEDANVDKETVQKGCEEVVKSQETKRVFYVDGDFYALSNEILYRSGKNGSSAIQVGPASDFIIKDIDGNGQRDLVFVREKVIDVQLNGGTTRYELAHNFAPGTFLTNFEKKEAYSWLLPNKLIGDVKKECGQ